MNQSILGIIESPKIPLDLQVIFFPIGGSQVFF